MATTGNANRFAAAMMDDSDDENAIAAQKQTKTQKKKEERKIADVKPKKVDTTKMAEGGFEVIDNEVRQNAPRGGRGGGRGGERGRGGDRRGRGMPQGERGGGEWRGRGGRGGNYRGRPQTAQPITDADGKLVQRLDSDGNKIADKNKGPEGQRFRGKARQDDTHPFDRRDGTGKARRGDKKEGAGKAGWGTKTDVKYKAKGSEDIKEQENKTLEEEKVEVKEEEPKYIEEIIGQSYEDYFKTVKTTEKKNARDTEGIKGEKTAAKTTVKEGQQTMLQNQYMKGTHAKTADSNNKFFGFEAQEEERPAEEQNTRGGRGGRGRGVQRKESLVEQGRKRQNARKNLEKTDQEYPTL